MSSLRHLLRVSAYAGKASASLVIDSQRFRVSARLQVRFSKVEAINEEDPGVMRSDFEPVAVSSLEMETSHDVNASEIMEQLYSNLF